MIKIKKKPKKGKIIFIKTQPNYYFTEKSRYKDEHYKYS
jgi:hypothetical protein